ncbi:MAG: hypothetical protein K0S47_4580 [Herbinix sp.]|jgi:hypothetical protein|nr:hypothetical protein [Herbinix sp.]MDF2842802.1 hypothetical protein [Herbinix sp.]
MSNFSQTLKNFVSNQEITIQTLSKISGVDRSFIQHILAGKRIPADITVLEKIMKALMLTPSQEQKLRHLYNVDRLGEDNYNRHLSVKDMIENIDSIKDSNSFNVNVNYNHDFSNFQSVNVLSGISEINYMLKAIIEVESTKKDGYVKLLIQPEHSFLLELLLSIGKNSSLHMEHIFCLNKEVSVNSDNYQNLKYVKNVMPLLLSEADYNVFIYYDDLDVKFNNTSLFPYFIITSDKVIAISPNLNYALFYMTADVHQLYKKLYNDMYHLSIPLVEKVYDPLDYLNKYHQLEFKNQESKNSNLATYSFLAQPCFMYFTNREQLNKYMYDFPQKDEVVSLMAKRSESYYQLLLKGHMFTSYFNEEGLDSFWSTGRISEVPDSFYDPITKDDCMKLLEVLYKNILETPYQAIAVDPDKLKISPYLSITAFNESMIFFMYIHPVKGPFHLVIQEKSIAYSVHSFLEYLKDSQLAYSRESTLDLLKRKIQQYKLEF